MVPKYLYSWEIFHSREALNDLYVTSECQSYSLEFGKNASSCQATNIINILFGQEKNKIRSHEQSMHIAHTVY